jgi:hypothetical protein
LKTIQELKVLGEKRSSVPEMTAFLMKVSTSYQSIVDDAVDGHYEHDFFGQIDTTKGFEDGGNRSRLRAAVQYLNLQFASQMRQYGHKFRIWETEEAAGTNSKKDLPEPDLEEDYGKAKSLQKVLTRAEAVDRVKDILVRTRGRELAGNFNPLLMSQLFWEQSENWERLALEHIDRVNAVCTDLVRTAIDGAVWADVAAKLKAARLEDGLKNRLELARGELALLIEDKKRPPITYDPSYIANVKKAREKKTDTKWKALIAQSTVEIEQDGKKQKLANPDVLRKKMQELQDNDMDKQSAEDALDSQLAYYKVHPAHTTVGTTKHPSH